MSRDPAARIVVLTTYDTDEDVYRAIQAGAKSYLLKDMSTEQIIGTIRADGAPRLSGTEVHVEDGQLRIGMMSDAHKLADVLRDPRVEVHSAPIELDLANGDAKVAGRLRPSGSPPSRSTSW